MMPLSDPEAASRKTNPIVAACFPFPVFDGYPYLVTGLMANVHHFLLLPADASATTLREVARRQMQANRLPTALALDDDFCLYLSADGTETLAPVIDGTGRAAPAWLLLAQPLPESRGLARRATRLKAFIDAQPAEPLRLELRVGGRPVPAEDREWLGTLGPEGVPHGLVRCPNCGKWRGECLGCGEASDSVVPVYCLCQNWNRCAACGGALAKQRLNAHYYNDFERAIDYMPGFKVMWHDCVS
jgi:hypothetical protein